MRKWLIKEEEGAGETGLELGVVLKEGGREPGMDQVLDLYDKGGLLYRKE